MTCLHCGQPRAFLVKGVCQACDPVVHANYQAAYAAASGMFARFERERGKNPVTAWEEYENWLLRQPDLAQYTAILQREFGGT